MKRFILAFVMFILVIALTVLTTILLVNYNASNGRLAILETKLTNFEALVGNLDSEEVDDTNQALESCNTASEDGRLVVFSPCDGATIAEEFTMYGIAQGFFENTLNYYVDSNNVVVDSGFVTYSASGDVGSAGIFNKKLDLSELDSGDEAVLVFYYEDAKDGAQKTLASINLVVE